MVYGRYRKSQKPHRCVGFGPTGNPHSWCVRSEAGVFSSSGRTSSDALGPSWPQGTELLGEHSTKHRCNLLPRLRSCPAAHREVFPSVTHRTRQYANKRTAVSHHHTREQEHKMCRFKSAAQVQRCLSVHGPITTCFPNHTSSSQRKLFPTKRLQPYADWVVNRLPPPQPGFPMIVGGRRLQLFTAGHVDSRENRCARRRWNAFSNSNHPKLRTAEPRQSPMSLA